MRIRLDVAYDGTDFRGWAMQPGLRTVEDSLATALTTALRAPRPPLLTCAGRTDAGVHARGQVVHLDTSQAALADSAGRSTEPPLTALVRRVNGILDPDVRVRRALAVPDGFDARYSALWRRYAYRIADDLASVDPLARRHVLVWPRPLDLAAMSTAGEALLGTHDFAAFCRRREGATTIRRLLDLQWARDESGRAVATVRADAFCHSMVRSVVGCLIAVGEGTRPLSWAAERLAAAERHPGVSVAPARGLTLEEVAYPPDADLAARVEITRARRLPVGGTT